MWLIPNDFFLEQSCEFFCSFSVGKPTNILKVEKYIWIILIFIIYACILHLYYISHSSFLRDTSSEPFKQSAFGLQKSWALVLEEKPLLKDPLCSFLQLFYWASSPLFSLTRKVLEPAFLLPEVTRLPTVHLFYLALVWNWLRQGSISGISHKKIFFFFHFGFGLISSSAVGYLALLSGITPGRVLRELHTVPGFKLR